MPAAGGTPATSTLVNSVGASGSVNIYSSSGLDFDFADINFFSSDTSVAQITGGEAFNPTFNLVGSDRFNSATISTDPSGASGNLLLVNASMNGVSQIIESFDPLFDSTVGPGGSSLLARVDFDIVGAGTSEFSLGLDDTGVVELPDIELFPTFGNATISTVPEPSSAIVLMMGFVGMVARRKRA